MGGRFEPYVQLVDVTDSAALIAWGGFRLGEHGGRWRAERAGGSGLEDEETVRAAAYGYHPEPGGWRDEKDG